MRKREKSLRPDNLKLRGKQPTIGVVGAGLSGLLTAIRIKEKGLPVEVVVLDKPRREANTQISGMRIRAKRAGSRATKPEERSAEVVELFAKQNNGLVTEPMREFAQLLGEELTVWNHQLSSADSGLVQETHHWFGPQWGKLNQSGRGGRGLSVLTWLDSVASDQGVKFLTGEAQALENNEGAITAIKLAYGDREYAFRPDLVILANGSVAGRLFLSTNQLIRNSATELLFNAGLPLEGGSLIMWHPFGNCRPDGRILPGCYETDSLAKTNVYYRDGTKDQKTTQLLQEHQAHYHFREIVQRFLVNGGVVRLVDHEGERFARVSLHYSHLGAQTIDGTRVAGTSNLAVTGDAGGLLHWTNHQTRLPGFALAHCLVSARKAADWVRAKIEGDEWVTLEDKRRLSETHQRAYHPLATSQSDLREINTKHALALEFGESGLKLDQIASWTRELTQLGERGLKPLSLALTQSWARLVNGEHEPILLNQELVNDHLREMGRESARELHPRSRRL